jgi:hypothetical protein
MRVSTPIIPSIKHSPEPRTQMHRLYHGPQASKTPQYKLVIPPSLKAYGHPTIADFSLTYPHKRYSRARRHTSQTKSSDMFPVKTSPRCTASSKPYKDKTHFPTTTHIVTTPLSNTAMEERGSSHHHTFKENNKAFTKAFLHAKFKCKPPHSAPWHPKLHECYQIYNYWRKTQQSKANNKDLNAHLSILRHQLQSSQIDPFQGNPHRTPLHQLNMARSNLQKERKGAIMKRQQHLTFRQEILVLEGKKQQSKAVATIQRAERRARCFRKFHTFTKSVRVRVRKSTLTPTPTTYQPTGPATVWHIGDEVSNNIDETIRHAAGTMDLRSYIQEKYGWTDPTTDNIDWLIHCQALQTLTLNDRKTCTQHIHEWLPTCGHPGQTNITTT